MSARRLGDLFASAVVVASVALLVLTSLALVGAAYYLLVVAP
jgi:hypothetical protein